MTLRRQPIARSTKPIKRGRPIVKGRRPARSKKPIAKRRKGNLTKLKDKLWDLFALYVKDRDERKCFTCDTEGLQGSNCHAGHLVTRGRSSTLFSPANVFVQDYRCNIQLKGNGAEFTFRYIDRFGEAKFRVLMAKSREIKRWTEPELVDLIAAIKKGGAEYEMLYAERYGI